MATILKIAATICVCGLLAVSLVISAALVGVIAGALAYLAKLAMADTAKRVAELKKEFRAWFGRLCGRVQLFVAIARNTISIQSRAAWIQTRRGLLRAKWFLFTACSCVATKLVTFADGIFDAVTYTVGSALGRLLVSFLGARLTTVVR